MLVYEERQKKKKLENILYTVKHNDLHYKSNKNGKIKLNAFLLLNSKLKNYKKNKQTNK